MPQLTTLLLALLSLSLLLNAGQCRVLYALATRLQRERVARRERGEREQLEKDRHAAT